MTPIITPGQSTTGQSPKKAYRQPQLKSLGSVRNLTLKTGSSVDAFGRYL